MSDLTNQKQAVVNAVTRVLGTSFTVGTTKVKNVLSKQDLSTVRNNIFEGIKSGSIQFNKTGLDDKALRRYVNGMIDNHFRKAKELNGGSKYVPTNPGRGKRDSELRTLKQLRKQYQEGTEEFKKVNSAISVRETQLTTERREAAAVGRKSTVHNSINTDLLPEGLSSTLNEG